MDKNKIIEVKVPYDEWVKCPFPQTHALQIDTTTKYIVTNCPPEYAEELKKMGIKFEIPPSTVTITFYPKVKLEKVKCEMERIDYASSSKIIVTPKSIGINESVFDSDGRTGFTRIIYKKKQNNNYCFNYIKVGDNTLNYYPVFSAYSFPSNIADYSFNCEFKKGDKFELLADDEIEKIELWLSEKINIKRKLA